MKAAALVGLALLAGLPAGAQAAPPDCPYGNLEVIASRNIPDLDPRCGYEVGPVRNNVAIVHLKPPPARPAVSSEMLELMRLDLERRQMELDRMERMRRERANRELGMFMLRQAFRPPVYVPPPPQPTPQDRHTQYLLQEYLRNELARQRREKLLGPYD